MVAAACVGAAYRCYLQHIRTAIAARGFHAIPCTLSFGVAQGLEAAARLQTLELVLNPEPDRKEGELSQEALSTLALLKLQHSLKKVAVSTGCKRFSRGQYLILAAMGLCPPPHPRRARHPC